MKNKFKFLICFFILDTFLVHILCSYIIIIINIVINLNCVIKAMIDNDKT